MAAFVGIRISAEQLTGQLSGTVEVDGAYFGGKVKQENKKADRKDRRLVAEQSGKRQVVVVARERDGRTLTTVTEKESFGIRFLRSIVSNRCERATRYQA